MRAMFPTSSETKQSRAASCSSDMRGALLIALIIGTLPIAAQCPDPRYRELRVGGDKISSHVSIARQPVQSALVRLYSSGRLLRTTHTNDQGGFTIDAISPGQYTLSIDGWGSIAVRVDPELDEPFQSTSAPLTHLLSVSGSGEFPALVEAPKRDDGLGQHPIWTIILSDRGCASSVMSMD